MALFARNQWLLNRLKSMSIGEILYRVGKQIETGRELRAFRRRVFPPVPPPVMQETKCWIFAPKGLQDEERYIAAANRIVGGRLRIFQLDVDADAVIRNWNRDPKTRTAAPMTFGKAIDCHDRALVGDIKYLWEPNRHLHLPLLAQAYRLSGKAIYLKALKLHLSTWLAQCPYPAGPNWSSSLELAVRLINWSVAWQLIGCADSVLFEGDNGRRLRDRWLSSVYRHMAFISGHFSRHSSANNHLIGEAAGLFIGSNTWPYWGKVTDRWRHTGFGILADEAVRQVHPDGAGKEQAMAYQQFVLDFLILSLISGKVSGVSFPPAYSESIVRRLAFVAAMMDVAGNLPMIGDADDGYVANLSQESDFCPYQSQLATGAVLFTRSDFFRKARRIDDKTRWLTGAFAETAMSLPAKTLDTKRAFPAGGYFILGRDFETADEIRCIVDCGPLGYLSIAAHGHADALALYLSVGGAEFLIDPGTFSYHGGDLWRAYFRGTAAHNTVRIDGVDQSLSGGKFMWLKKANAQVVTFEIAPDRDVFEGSHDGYRRLSDPVMHRRKVVFDKERDVLSIEDILECAADHVVERFWHFHEDCKVVLNGGRITAERNGTRIRLTTHPPDTRLSLYRGDEVLPRGWVARRYDERVPAVTVAAENRISQTTSLRTDIHIQVQGKVADRGGRGITESEAL